MTERCTLTFQPGDVKVLDVPRGETVLRAAMQANIHINASCGGSGTCGKCRIQMVGGVVESERSAKLDDQDWADGIRLACRTTVQGDAEIFIPQTSRMGNAAVLERELRIGERKGRLLTPAQLESLVTGWTLDPVVKKLCMHLTPPSEGENLNDLARFKKGLKDTFGLTNASVDSVWIRNMPSVLREQDWEVTATVVDTAYGYKVIELEPGSHCGEDYSVVLDIGTTTVWGQLLDLIGGETLAQASDYNHQISFGEDVISRIVFSQKKEGRERLQQAIVDTVNGIVDELVAKAGIDRTKISHMVAAGNTTMTCLLTGIDPKYLRMSPYVPPADFIPPVRAVNLGSGINVGRHVHLYTFPSVASYVGGDIVSGIVGSGIFETEKITLYIDIGTNGEVVVGNREWLIATSCSAGPAFEGGGVKHGMRATDGAIETVRDRSRDLRADHPDDQQPASVGHLRVGHHRRGGRVDEVGGGLAERQVQHPPRQAGAYARPTAPTSTSWSRPSTRVPVTRSSSPRPTSTTSSGRRRRSSPASPRCSRASPWGGTTWSRSTSPAASASTCASSRPRASGCFPRSTSTSSPSSATAPCWARGWCRSARTCSRQPSRWL